MKRWLVFTLGLGMAVMAGVSLLTGSDLVTSSEIASRHEVEPQHPEIDKESRDRLRAILREADRDEASAP